jgi:hypothetical protein
MTAGTARAAASAMQPGAPRVRIVGAFDRFNYGDVLFAHLSEGIVRARWPDAEIGFFGTQRSDLRAEGGVRTGNLRDIFAEPARPDDVIWVAGGEVLGSRWHLMVEHGMPLPVARLWRDLRRRISSTRADWMAQHLARVPNRLPWVFDRTGFAGATPRVVYLNVGGLYAGKGMPPALADWQRRRLAEVTWLSLRDSGSVATVAELTGQRWPLLPDSAVMMPSLPQAAAAAREARLATLLPRITPGWAPKQRYLCLQCGINYIAGQEDLLAAEVEAVHALTGLPVVAFAIGRASGHEDQVSAKRLAARLEGRAWFRRAPDDLDIWQIMALIAGSAGYIGSSLHGFITAFAFAVPRVGLAPKVKKLITFRDDWDLPTMPAGVAFADLPVAVTQALAQDPAAMVAQAARVRAQAEAGLADLWAAVDPNTGEVTGD